MKIHSYNSKNEEKFSDLIKLLKSLPRERADADFEFRLMTRIENKNFEPNIPEKRFYISRYLVPASAFAVSILILFFIVNDSGIGVENPFLDAPALRHDYSSSITDTIELRESNLSIPTAGQSADAAELPQTSSSGLVRVVVEPSDAVTVEEVELPFDDNNSLDLDSYVSGENKQNSSAVNRGQLVGGGRSFSQFDGFLIRERPSRQTIETHKARLDSAKKSQK